MDVTVQDIGLPIGLEDELWVRVTLGDTVVFDGSQEQLAQRAVDSGARAPRGGGAHRDHGQSSPGRSRRAPGSAHRAQAARGVPARRRLRRRTGVKVVFSLALLIGVWSVAGGGTYAALSGTTSNTSNAFSAGTVVLTDNDGGSTAMFNFANQRPGVTATSCIKVLYSGTLSATVKLYGTVTGTLGPYVNLVVTRGTDSTPSFSGCSGFTPDPTNYNGLGAGVLYSGTLAGYPAGYASAVSDPEPRGPPGAAPRTSSP